MIRIFDLSACAHIKAQLVTLWQEAFGDSEDYIRTFMREVGSNTKVVVCEVDEQVVSATYLLPVSYVQKDGTMLNCYYLYAAATLGVYRGRGYFGRILQFVNEHINAPIILVPASTSLVDYYKGHNFHIWLTEKKEALDNWQPNVTKAISKEEYCKFRKEVLYKPHSMLWGDEMMDYIFAEHEKAGGHFAEAFIDDTRVLFMCIGEGKDRNILEMVSHNERFRIQPIVMANSALLKDGKGYFNLTMG